MRSRNELINSFLAANGWQHARREALGQDASFRRYWRLHDTQKSALLMDAPPPEKPVSLFAEIARFLRANDLYAPEIFALDDLHGLMLIEDFGDDTFTRILASDPDQESVLYELAIDTLLKLHRTGSYSTLSVPEYDLDALLGEVYLFSEWFYPAVCGNALNERQQAEFAQAWRESIGTLAPHRKVLVLRDFHVDNLMRVETPDQATHCGLLDFQDALIGSPAYDLISLLEDARRDISGDLKAGCFERYFRGMGKQPGFPGEQALTPWLNLLAAQRHAKVLGIFVRLYRRDKKPNYLEHLPRVLALYAAALEREPALSPVARWMDSHMPLADITLAHITTRQ